MVPELARSARRESRRRHKDPTRSRFGRTLHYPPPMLDDRGFDEWQEARRHFGRARDLPVDRAVAVVRRSRGAIGVFGGNVRIILRSARQGPRIEPLYQRSCRRAFPGSGPSARLLSGQGTRQKSWRCALAIRCSSRAERARIDRPNHHLEPFGARGRAGYYDEVGALRDLVRTACSLLSLGDGATRASHAPRCAREGQGTALAAPVTGSDVSQLTVTGHYDSGAVKAQSSASMTRARQVEHEPSSRSRRMSILALQVSLLSRTGSECPIAQRNHHPFSGPACGLANAAARSSPTRW